MSILQLADVSQSFGKLQAITNFNLSLDQNEIVGIIGPNGAGKTTLFNVICGIYTPQQGTISLAQESILGLSTNIIARKGIARTFQNIRLFKKMTVLDNIRCVVEQHYSLCAALVTHKSELHAEEMLRQTAWNLLTLFKLETHAQKNAEALPYGLQRRLEIARAMATQPKVLLLDEPACGMNNNESAALRDLILEIKSRQQIAVLLIDHQIPFVMSLCPRIIVLDFGKIIAEGAPDYIRNHPEVIKSYLGGM